MKTVSSTEIGDYFVDQIDESVSSPAIKTEYYSDTQSTWKEIDAEYVESRTITLSNRNNRYQVQSFLPPVQELKLTLNNYGYEWNDGQSKAGIIAKNRFIRCWSGLNIPIGIDNNIADDFTTNNKQVQTLYSGGVLTSAPASYPATFASAADYLIYSTFGSSATYGSAQYGYIGYYTKRFTLPASEENEATHFKITSSSNKFSAKYRVSDNSNFFGAIWSSYVQLSAGVNSIAITADPNYNYIQYIIRFEGNTYGTDTISSASLHYQNKSQLFKQGTFILDEPEFTDVVAISGRDYLRKALETEINMPALSAVPITTALTKVFDRCSIPYATAEWDLSATTISISSTLAESLNNESAYKVADKLMSALNAGDDEWKFKFNDEGRAIINIVPTATEADFLAHYFFHIENATKDLDSDRQLQRVTAVNKDIVVNSETLLKSVSGSAIASLSVTYPSALYVRYEDNNGTILTESARTNTSVSFTMSLTAYDIDVYGCTPKNAITNEIWAERGNALNIIGNNGNTHKEVNPFFSQTIAQKYCDYLLSINGDPAKRVNLTMLKSPLSELDDNFLVYTRETADNTLFTLSKITENWGVGSMLHSLELIDSGYSFTNITWDRNGAFEGLEDNKFDTSLIWEYDLGVYATADNDTYLSPVRTV